MSSPTIVNQPKGYTPSRQPRKLASPSAPHELPTGQAVSTPSPSTPLSTLLDRFKKHLLMPDTGGVELVLGTYAANILAGDPVWVAIMGPPSSGKGESLAPIESLPHVFQAATLTEAALLSGVKASERSDDTAGGLLCEMGEFGILVMKDFTSVLSMARDARNAMLAALREIFDGRWTRRLGVDGGRRLSWQGKMGLIAGVTHALDSHHSVMGEMGPRFLLFRLPPVDAQKQAKQALSNSGKEAEMREELRREVGKFFTGLDLKSSTSLPNRFADDDDWLVLLSAFASRCRSAVERHPHTREILLVPEPELPARLVRSAAQLHAGLGAIGVPPDRCRELVSKTVMDCIPPVRRAVIDFLAHHHPDGTSILDVTGLPKQTVKNALDDLKCHGVVRHTTAGWEIAETWHPHVRAAYPDATFSKAKVSMRIGTGSDD